MAFGKLDHPATPEDVEKAMAIFSLGPGARVVELPQYPMKAKWVTLKDYPVQYQGTDREGNRTYRLDYDQDGLIWQAEEIQENGQWKRYYGFVGHYIVAKVPAEEVELVEK